MPVQEIKNPVPQPAPALSRSETSGQVTQPLPIIRIRRYQGRPVPAKQRPAGHGPALLPAGDDKLLRQLLRQFNQALERQGIPLHLVLLAGEEGYLLEVFDCTRDQVCLGIKDLEIRPGDLPALLAKLQREAGLLVDIFS